MKILYLSMNFPLEKDGNNIYTDLAEELSKENKVDVVVMNGNTQKTTLTIERNMKVIRVQTGRIFNVNIIKKAISYLMLPYQIKKSTDKLLKNESYDLVIYTAPPVTIVKLIQILKIKYKCKTLLMQKDIFPQNAVDLKMFKKNSIIYKYFRYKEIELYKISDFIGCMSPKNKEYLIEHNKYLDVNKLDILPNSISPKKGNIRNSKLNIKYRKKYNIPLDAKVYMYGGNLGKPQGIPFIIECLKEVAKLNDIYFVICGKGTEYEKLNNFKNNYKIDNLLLLNGLSNKEYNELLNIADIGLIFLDYNFTIPNFPSRILSYMEKGIPILSCTDPNTDVGDIIEDNDFGWKCYSNDVRKFIKLINKINRLTNNELVKKGNNGLEYLKNNYTSERSYNTIMKKNKKKKILILTTVFAPYRVELFNEISKNKNIDLTVCFEQVIDKERNNDWYNYNTSFKSIILKFANKSIKFIKYEFITILKKKKNYDLVIFYEPSTITAALAIKYCIFNNIQYMLNCDGAILKEKENLLKKLIKTRNVKNSAGLISNGKSAKEYYLNYGAKEEKIYNHHFSNLKNDEILTRPLSIKQKEQIKKELNLKYKYVFISVGNFIYRKGFDLYLNAIKKFNSENKNYKNCGFIIIGSGIKKDKYLDYIKENKLDNVEIKDFMSKEQLLKYYDASNCFCLLTRYDIWGLVIHEAMARGLPVISTNKCNAALELVKNDKYGYIIDIDKPSDIIADEVKRCFYEISLKDSMQDCNAIIENSKKYTIEISAKEHIDIINNVLKNDE